MSIEEKTVSDEVQDAIVRLLAGREPSPAALARCPTLKAWRLLVRPAGRDRRVILVEGTLASERFTVKNQQPMPVRVLWMDRKFRFAVTTAGMWNLGERERDVDVDLKLPVAEKADD